MKTGKFNEAISNYKKAIAINPQNIANHKQLGDLLQEKGNLDGALKSYRQAIAIDPKNSQSNLINRLIADILVKKGKKAQAKVYYKKAA